jgi:hypothetical protein
MHYQETLQEGQLVTSGAGGFGCGYNAILHDAKGDVSIPSVSATYRSDGTVGLQSSYKTDVGGQLIADVKGPPGPCNLTHPTPTCDCPIGSGLQTSTQVRLVSADALSAVVKLSSDSQSWLHYDLGHLSPASLVVTVNVSLEQVGSLQIPISVDLPQTSLASGSAPNVFAGKGEIKIKEPVPFSKTFKISITPTSSTPDEEGYAAKAKAEIIWLSERD